MKKAITMMTALALAGALGVSNLTICASASGINGDSASATVTLNYSVSEGYTITIPTTPITVSTDGTDLTVEATDILLSAGSTLKLTVASGNNDFKMYTAEDTGKANGLAYTVKKDGTAISSGADVLSIAAGTTSTSTSLNIALSDTPTYAGDYTDTLTFSASVASTN